MDVEELYWKLRDADEATLTKEIDRAIKEGHGKELTQAVTRIIVNMHSKLDVYWMQLNQAENYISEIEAKNKKLHKVINKMHEVMKDAPGEDNR